MEVIFAACSATRCLTVQVSWVGSCVQIFLLLKICTLAVGSVLLWVLNAYRCMGVGFLFWDALE